MWPFTRKPRAAKAKAASAALSGDVINPLAGTGSVTPLSLLAPVAAPRREGHLGMQGYAPIVTVSKHRRYCEYCAERVHANVRHICWGNAEHHLHTLTDEERAKVLDQLAKKPRRLNRVQLWRLYKSDGGPTPTLVDFNGFDMEALDRPPADIAQARLNRKIRAKKR